MNGVIDTTANLQTGRCGHPPRFAGHDYVPARGLATLSSDAKANWAILVLLVVALSRWFRSRGSASRRGREQGMAAQSSLKSIDVQKVISGAAELEVKALLAGVEYLQAWISQAGKLAGIAGDTLQAIKNDKGSLSDTARRLTDFGKQNAEVFADLSSKMSKSYYSELDRIVTAVTSKPEKRKAGVKAAARSPTAGRCHGASRARRGSARRPKGPAHALRMHFAVERRVLEHDLRSNGEQLITRKEARLLIASGYYRESTGSPHDANHFRRSLSDGSCLHLVLERRRTRLHHDAFDPHANPLSLGCI